MTKKVFDNCLIQAPDGVNLSRCSAKKLQWYIDMGLADKVAEDPATIRLRFEPSGREGVHDPLLMDGKPNICVVCGVDDNLNRHHIVPYCFIKHMKIECKIDVLRDIFPLCAECHNRYERKSEQKKKSMAQNVCHHFPEMDKTELRRMRVATHSASALLRYIDKIPIDKQKMLFEIVFNFLGKSAIEQKDLEKLSKIKVPGTGDFSKHFKYIAQNVENYDEFAKEWRTHFIETMKPQHMPDAWKIDRKSGKVWVPRRCLKS